MHSKGPTIYDETLTSISEAGAEKVALVAEVAAEAQ
jgi:hypothetical protein